MMRGWISSPVYTGNAGIPVLPPELEGMHVMYVLQFESEDHSILNRVMIQIAEYIVTQNNHAPRMRSSLASARTPLRRGGGVWKYKDVALVHVEMLSARDFAC